MCPLDCKSFYFVPFALLAQCLPHVLTEQLIPLSPNTKLNICHPPTGRNVAGANKDVHSAKDSYLKPYAASQMENVQPFLEKTNNLKG